MQVSNRNRTGTVKTCYFRKLYRRAADPHPTMLAVLDTTEFKGNAKVRYITRINVPPMHRGRKIGHDLLTECCVDADWAGVTLELDISPYPDSPLGRRELRRWYERFGFVKVKGKDHMIREPGLTSDPTEVP